MLCILYVIATSTGLGAVGLLVERALPATAARRWVWCAVIGLSMFLPGYYRTHHTWAVDRPVGEQMLPSPLGQVLEMSPLLTLDPKWWERVETVSPIIGRAWFIISGVLLLWGLVNVWRVSRVVSLSRGSGDARPTVVDDVPVLVTNSIGPATVGLLRSRVLLPRWVLALPGSERRYVVRHEEEHRRSHDAHLLFAMSLTLLLAPWNLALWWHLRRLRLAVELDCDNRVVAALGDAPAYGKLLFKVAQATSHGPRLQPAFLGGAGTLERRLTMLLAPTPLRSIQRFLLPAIACVLLFFVLSMPHPILASDEPAAHAQHSATE